MRFPVTDERGDYLLYHRFTGFPGSPAGDVLALVEKGSVLNPYSVRAESDHDAEIFGLDPIDIAAGDGEAVFLTPGRPVAPSMWGKTGFLSTPGVAFRLLDVERIADVSVRPQDFQTFYVNLIDRSALKDPFGCMTRVVDDPYDHASYLDMLAPSLRLIRTAEQWGDDVKVAIDSVLRSGAPLPFEMPRLYARDADSAVEEAVEFCSEFSYCDGIDPDEFYANETLVETVRESIEAALIEQHEEAWSAWDRTSPERIEVLAWGSLPMSAAYLVFDGQQVLYL